MEDKKRFDADTGEETVESLLAQKEISDIETIETAQHLTNLKGSDGFKILSKFLTDNVTYWSAKLLECRDLSDMIRCQEIIKSYQTIFAWIETSIDAARQIHEEKG